MRTKEAVPAVVHSVWGMRLELMIDVSESGEQAQ